MQDFALICRKMQRISKVRNNGAEGSRTLDLCSAIAALSQLSYRPFDFIIIERPDSPRQELSCPLGLVAEVLGTCLVLERLGIEELGQPVQRFDLLLPILVVHGVHP
jgi:hypothetical protein